MVPAARASTGQNIKLAPELITGSQLCRSAHGGFRGEQGGCLVIQSSYRAVQMHHEAPHIDYR